MSFISSVPVLLTVITAVATLWSAAFLTGKFSPNIELRLIPNWSQSGNKIKLVIEIENTGFIRVGLDKVLLYVNPIEILIDSAKNMELAGNEWIDFDHAEKIMTSSFYINPKETIHIERIYVFNSSYAIHSGIQVYLKFPWFIHKLGAQARSSRQTRTYYFFEEIDKQQKSASIGN